MPMRPPEVETIPKIEMYRQGVQILQVGQEKLVGVRQIHPKAGDTHNHTSGKRSVATCLRALRG